MYEDFEVRWDGLLPGSPEQVWDAITVHAIGWIWDIEYEPRVGGAEHGLTGAGGTVTAWEPARHFQTVAERADGWRNQLDYRIEPAEGGALLRYAHTSRTTDHATEYEACARHTDFYHHSLGQYLEHFAGRDAQYVAIEAPGTLADVRRRLGIPDGAAVGDAVALPPGLAATVDYVAPAFLGVRAADALIRVFDRHAWGGGVSVYLHLFDPQADAAGAERAFRTALAASPEAVA